MRRPTNLMELEEFIAQLSFDFKCRCVLIAADEALNVWDNFACDSILKYRDTVVGLSHEVDKRLPHRVVDLVRSFINSELEERIRYQQPLEDILSEYLEPIVALQDDDWQLPNFAKMAFYSVWNLLEGVKNQTDNRIFAISISQACEALVLWNIRNNYVKLWWEKWQKLLNE